MFLKVLVLASAVPSAESGLLVNLRGKVRGQVQLQSLPDAVSLHGKDRSAHAGRRHRAGRRHHVGRRHHAGRAHAEDALKKDAENALKEADEAIKEDEQPLNITEEADKHIQEVLYTEKAYSGDKCTDSEAVHAYSFTKVVDDPGYKCFAERSRGFSFKVSCISGSALWNYEAFGKSKNCTGDVASGYDANPDYFTTESCVLQQVEHWKWTPAIQMTCHEKVSGAAPVQFHLSSSSQTPTPAPTSTSVCEDDPLFQDADGFNCFNWVGYDCNAAVTDVQYTQQEQDELIEHCPLSCGTCTNHRTTTAPTTTPAASNFSNELFANVTSQVSLTPSPAPVSTTPATSFSPSPYYPGFMELESASTEPVLAGATTMSLPDAAVQHIHFGDNVVISAGTDTEEYNVILSEPAALLQLQKSELRSGVVRFVHPFRYEHPPGATIATIPPSDTHYEDASVLLRCLKPDTDHGATATRTRYKADLAIAPDRCVSESQTATCNHGSFTTWSGTYIYPSCRLQIMPMFTPTAQALDVAEHPYVPFTPTKFWFHGCFQTETPVSSQVTMRFAMTHGICFGICSKYPGMNYFAIAGGATCYCSDVPLGEKLEDQYCSSVCEGNTEESQCGGPGTTASFYTMYKCVNSSVRLADDMLFAHKRAAKVLASYRKVAGYQCAHYEDDNAIEVGNDKEMPTLRMETRNGSPEDCMQACWNEGNAIDCMGFTYINVTKQCKFVKDVFGSHLAPNNLAACYYKDTIGKFPLWFARP